MRRHCMWTYLVGWPDSLVIKAGVTGRRRWRLFCTRGAKLYLLHLADENAPGGTVCDVEIRVEAWLADNLAPAFASKDEGRSHLGNRGAGYMECYRAPNRDAYMNALARCRRIMREHPTGQCGNDVRALMHGRTDARTNEDPHSPDATIFLFSDARAHIREMAVDKSGGNA